MPAPPRPTVVVLRFAAGTGLAWCTVTALTAGALPLTAKMAALVVIGLTAWAPIAGLVTAIALAPAGLLLAAPPARTAELLVWSFLAAWMLSLWRPLGNAPHRRILLPAVLYGLCASASWLAYTVGGAAGVEPSRVPFVVARAVPLDHLVFSSPEPETFTLLPLLAGLALFVAAASIATDSRRRLAVGACIAVSTAVLSVVTIGYVLLDWASFDYGSWFLLRYLRGERFSLHLRDLNAAGSHYLLGALIAVGMAAADRARRALWTSLAIITAPALWISGSRSASLGGFLVGASLIPYMMRRVPVRIARAHIGVLLVAATAGVAVAGVAIASGPAEHGTASNALRLRSQFLVTSARMLASAPVFGVGIGHYHERSNQFMPPTLREVYRHENAHNYFAQQFAELGIVGGTLFVWFVAAVLRAAWHAARSQPADATSLALLAGAGGYLLTCVTGHPLLVPETAMPFWAAVGVLAAAAPSPSSEPALQGRSGLTRWLMVAAVAAACANVALHVRQYAMVRTPPGERGFYALETSADGRPFVWMTRHGVFYVGPQPGTITIPLRSPDFLKTGERFRVTVDVGGRATGVYDVRSDGWTTIEIPMRRAAPTPFRRIDLRANRSWSPMRDRGAGEDDDPRSVMVGETRWTPVGAR